MSRFIGLGFAGLVALIVAGFILGGYLDATGSSSIPGLPWLTHQPRPLRVVIELAVGIPVAFGVFVFGFPSSILGVAFNLNLPLDSPGSCDYACLTFKNP